jgi:hypothetical protein
LPLVLDVINIRDAIPVGGYFTSETKGGEKRRKKYPCYIKAPGTNANKFLTIKNTKIIPHFHLSCLFSEHLNHRKMGFYDLAKEERVKLVETIRRNICAELAKKNFTKSLAYFSDDDTYIRKSAYLAVGRIYVSHPEWRPVIIDRLNLLLKEPDFKVRQTTINAAGEIGMHDFKIVQHFFDQGLFDTHHSVRNAVIGSVKKMGEKNPVPVLAWAKTYLHHPDKEIRREICHGIELRGRTHPQDILPLLKELEFDQTARVKNTLVHVLGQIAYKKGCLATVIKHLNGWKNKEVVAKAAEEIIDVHDRYKNFSVLSQKEAMAYVDKHLKL